MTSSVLDRPAAGWLCHCGCGQITAIARRTDHRWGTVRGRHTRFVPGHNIGPAAAERARLARRHPPATGPAVTRRCIRCDFPIHTGPAPTPPGFRWHYGRGLCSVCRPELDGTDQLYDYPPRNRSRDDVLDDWDRLRTDGVNRTLAAERMGMTRVALERAIYRGRADGDPRAVLGNP